MIGVAINIFLVSFMLVVAVLVLRTQRLFAAIVMSAAYSLISAMMFVNLDAVDVAFTEAAVGAGISTVLLLAAMARLPAEEKAAPKNIAGPLVVVTITALLLMIGVINLPPFGLAEAPAHTHVSTRYLEESFRDLHIPNTVTTVLASYRGFDTLGETIVIFTAGLGVLILLTGKTLLRTPKRNLPHHVMKTTPVRTRKKKPAAAVKKAAHRTKRKTGGRG
jgi:multicomponent Na+:H+ antiporter subunit B